MDKITNQSINLKINCWRNRPKNRMKIDQQNQPTRCKLLKNKIKYKVA